MGLTLDTVTAGSRNLRTYTLISKKLDKFCHYNVLDTCSSTWVSKTLTDDLTQRRGHWLRVD